MCSGNEAMRGSMKCGNGRYAFGAEHFEARALKGIAQVAPGKAYANLATEFYDRPGNAGSLRVF